MFGKLFASTYTGSMVGSGLHVFATWGYVIANTRASGHVELNPPIIAATLGCTAGEVQAAIDILCAPDPKSRNGKEEGKRLVQESAFLYRVVTHAEYRAMRNDDDRNTYMRDYMRDYRAGIKKGDKPAEKPKPTKPLKKQTAPPCPQDDIIAAYHEHCPANPKIRVWPDAARKHLTTRWNEDDVRQNLEWWVTFFKFVAKCPFLVGGKTDFKASLVWLVNPTNIAKVLNGNYEEDKA